MHLRKSALIMCLLTALLLILAMPVQSGGSPNELSMPLDGVNEVKLTYENTNGGGGPELQTMTIPMDEPGTLKIRYFTCGGGGPEIEVEVLTVSITERLGEILWHYEPDGGGGPEGGNSAQGGGGPENIEVPMGEPDSYLAIEYMNGGGGPEIVMPLDGKKGTLTMETINGGGGPENTDSIKIPSSCREKPLIIEVV
jgi:hypothetical protein